MGRERVFGYSKLNQHRKYESHVKSFAIPHRLQRLQMGLAESTKKLVSYVVTEAMQASQASDISLPACEPHSCEKDYEIHRGCESVVARLSQTVV